MSPLELGSFSREESAHFLPGVFSLLKWSSRWGQESHHSAHNPPIWCGASSPPSFTVPASPSFDLREYTFHPQLGGKGRCGRQAEAQACFPRDPAALAACALLPAPPRSGFCFLNATYTVTTPLDFPFPKCCCIILSPLWLSFSFSVILMGLCCSGGKGM